MHKQGDKKIIVHIGYANAIKGYYPPRIPEILIQACYLGLNVNRGCKSSEGTNTSSLGVNLVATCKKITFSPK
ncbi:hypothetical protein ACTXT7_005666 [Hymenolepis weldensis]